MIGTIRFTLDDGTFEPKRKKNRKRTPAATAPAVRASHSSRGKPSRTNCFLCERLDDGSDDGWTECEYCIECSMCAACHARPEGAELLAAHEEACAIAHRQRKRGRNTYTVYTDGSGKIRDMAREVESDDSYAEGSENETGEAVS